MSRRVTIVTAGHLATCPRMLKAADALHGDGCAVRVITAGQTPWAARADRDLMARRGWRWEPIDYARQSSPMRWFATGLRTRAAMTLSKRLGTRSPYALGVNAYSRIHPELVRAILREPGDLIYGGTTGAIAAVTEASRVSGVPCGVDFEDFHCGEHEATGDGPLLNELAGRIMARAVRQAAFVTAGSAAIASACEARFGVPALAINNVFHLPAEPACDPSDGTLRLYWFSQTIGHGRGIEDVIRAAGRARVRSELHLRGVPATGFMALLHALAAREASDLRLVLHPPSRPDAMVEACRGFDAGISAEQGHIPNRALNLPNKALTYPLAGLALVLTDTPGQRPLAADLGGEALVYQAGCLEVLAGGLARWASTAAALRRARDAAWEAARTRWHWEHPLERDALLAAVRGTIA